jgi:hypothetical protein
MDALGGWHSKILAKRDFRCVSYDRLDCLAEVSRSTLSIVAVEALRSREYAQDKYRIYSPSHRKRYTSVHQETLALGTEYFTAFYGRSCLSSIGT